MQVSSSKEDKEESTYCNREKLCVVLEKLLPYYCLSLKLEEGPKTICFTYLRKKNPIICLKGAVTRIHKIFHGDAFIGKEKNSCKN